MEAEVHRRDSGVLSQPVHGPVPTNICDFGGAVMEQKRPKVRVSTSRSLRRIHVHRLRPRSCGGLSHADDALLVLNYFAFAGKPALAPGVCAESHLR